MHNSFPNTTLIVIIPLLALYLLMALRFVEKMSLRRLDDEFERISILPIISIRDAALITIGLDLAEITRLLINFQITNNIKHQLALVIVLMLFHFSALFFSTINSHAEFSEKSYSKSIVFNKLMHMYISAFLILTNAVTINILIGML